MRDLNRVTRQFGDSHQRVSRDRARIRRQPSSSTRRASMVAARRQLRLEPTDDLEPSVARARAATSSSMPLMVPFLRRSAVHLPSCIPFVGARGHYLHMGGSPPSPRAARWWECRSWALSKVSSRARSSNQVPIEPHPGPPVTHSRRALRVTGATRRLEMAGNDMELMAYLPGHAAGAAGYGLDLILGR